MKSQHFAAAAAALLAMGAAQADTLAQWNFNDQNLTVDVGSGSAAYTGGTVAAGTGEFAAGSPLSDPAVSPSDYAWNLSSFAAQGTADRTAGAVFSVSTVGYEALTFSYDSRHSGTAAKAEVVQVSTDGTTWSDVASFNDAASTSFYARTVDLSGLAAAANNALLAIRVVAGFAPGTTSYAGTTGSYGTTGTWRFDMVTISGTQIAAQVPEPSTYALLLAGIVAIGLMVRGRQKNDRHA